MWHNAIFPGITNIVIHIFIYQTNVWVHCVPNKICYIEATVAIAMDLQVLSSVESPA